MANLHKTTLYFVHMFQSSIVLPCLMLPTTMQNDRSKTFTCRQKRTIIKMFAIAKQLLESHSCGFCYGCYKYFCFFIHKTIVGNGLQLATVKWHRCLLATTLIISLFHFYNFICIFIPKECSTYFALFICHIAFLFNQHVITCKIFTIRAGYGNNHSTLLLL